MKLTWNYAYVRYVEVSYLCHTVPDRRFLHPHFLYFRPFLSNLRLFLHEQCVIIINYIGEWRTRRLSLFLVMNLNASIARIWTSTTTSTNVHQSSFFPACAGVWKSHVHYLHIVRDVALIVFCGFVVHCYFWTLVY